MRVQLNLNQQSNMNKSIWVAFIAVLVLSVAVASPMADPMAQGGQDQGQSGQGGHGQGQGSHQGPGGPGGQGGPGGAGGHGPSSGASN